ncbi:hypothetical protein B0T14DRAFT_607014 [Immersiella caudata]|uniref:Clr5 domain-containing protein n=1 Tax=Immersiella caudata TaxID=314043 RepID=A0AA39U385_9PEZI|nr:hypothetical protein B0T14DRAFT_607014 [Immersiella caudata]
MSRPFVWKTGPSVPRAVPISTSNWETHKEVICTLYRSKTLDELMEYMRAKHSFTPSITSRRKQYVLQLNKWGVYKYKRSHEQTLPDEARGATSLLSEGLNIYAHSSAGKRQKMDGDPCEPAPWWDDVPKAPAVGAGESCAYCEQKIQIRTARNTYCHNHEAAELEAASLLHSLLYEDAFDIYAYLLDRTRSHPEPICSLAASLSRSAKIGCARSAVTRKDLNEAERILWIQDAVSPDDSTDVVYYNSLLLWKLLLSPPKCDADASMEAMAPLDLLFQDYDGLNHHSDPTPKTASQRPQEALFPPADASMEVMAPLDLLFQDYDGLNHHSDPTPKTASQRPQEALFPPLADSLQSPDLKSMVALRDHAAKTVDLQSAMSKLSIDLPSAVLGKTSWNSIGSVLLGLSGASGRGVNYKTRTITSDGASGSLARMLRGRS